MFGAAGRRRGAPLLSADAKRRKIWTLSKDRGASVLRPISKVAVRFYLYTPPEPGGRRDYSFEDKLAGLEAFFSEPPWKAVATDFVDLSWEPLRKMLALLTAVMYLRNPQNLQVAWPAYRDGTDDDIKRVWLDQVGSAVWMAELLLNMRWSIIVSKEPVFITTDNPVVPLHPSLRFRGIKNPETMMMFPLSPTRLLWLDNRHREPKNQYYPLKDNGGDINGLLWRHAIENMFAHRDPHLVCTEILENAESMGFAC
jgi:Protein of unknown function (DUF4238)